MATLTETAYYSRLGIKWGSAGLLVFIVLRLIFGAAVAYYQSIPRPLKPDYYWGPLPEVSFPQVASPSGQLSFVLQTQTGTIPEVASAAARVYLMPKQSQHLLSLTESQAIVRRMGFDGEPREESKTQFQWTDADSQLRTIVMETTNKHFKLNYFFPYDLTLFTQRVIPSPQEATSEGISFLQQAQLDIPDIALTTPTVTYLKLVGNQLEPTSSQSQADGVRLDFFRQPYASIPVVTDTFSDGIIQMTMSGATDSKKRLLEVKYNYWPADAQQYGIYPIKTSQKAWEELQAGRTYIAKFPKDTTRIRISDVFLAYYDSVAAQTFMQPIYVFVGEKNTFAAYVSAVDYTINQ